MKRLSAALIALVLTAAVAAGNTTSTGSYYMNTNVQANPSQVQNTQAIGGGNAVSSSTSDAIAWAGGGSAYSEGATSGSSSAKPFLSRAALWVTAAMPEAKGGSKRRTRL